MTDSALSPRIAASAPSQRPLGHVVLVGMPGSGKSSVGAALASRLGRPFIDTDAAIENATGRAIREMFATEGEPAFRVLERTVVEATLSSPVPSVVSLGGGAVLDASTQAQLASAGQVVYLSAAAATLEKRVGDGAGRPLLAGDPAAAISRLLAERAPTYRRLARDGVVEVDRRHVADTVEAVARALVRRVPVALPTHPYEVGVGPRARDVLASSLPAGARKAVVVTQGEVGLVVDPGIETTRLTLPGGEAAKTMAAVEELCRGFVAAGLTRGDVVVAVGGGTVTDAAGFAAACYHRGTAVVHVATTLLAQVDAAIGGKTGVNLPEGKNLVGAFWQPDAVLCDTDALATLPEREWRSGLGEVAKYAFLGVEDLERLPLVEQVVRCAAAKAAVVADDERESGLRMRLNYGHTLAHALEAIDLAGGGDRRLDLRHGEAVAIGLVFAARLACRLGRIDEARLARHLEVVRAYGLPETIPEQATTEELLTAMTRDKKATTGLTFVLDGPAGPEPVREVAAETVLEVLVQSGARR